MIALIGSVAMMYCGLTLGRKLSDMDIVASYDDIVKYKNSIGDVAAFYPIQEGSKLFIKSTAGFITEADIAWEGSSAEALLELIEQDEDTRRIPNKEGVMFLYPSLDLLYMLKMSHRYKKDSPHFLKTMDDIILMRKHGAKIQDKHQSFYEQRQKDTYKNRLPSLNRSKADFFSGDGIIYEWDHDSLHEALKHQEKPAYQYFSGGEVWSDMDKFETLPEELKLTAVLEESLVLAAERSQLAFPDQTIDPDWSFKMALSKVCTSITSGRFREYAWERYYQVVAMYDLYGFDYMERVHEGIASGVVKRM